MIIIININTSEGLGVSQKLLSVIWLSSKRHIKTAPKSSWIEFDNSICNKRDKWSSLLFILFNNRSPIMSVTLGFWCEFNFNYLHFLGRLIELEALTRRVEVVLAVGFNESTRQVEVPQLGELAAGKETLMLGFCTIFKHLKSQVFVLIPNQHSP